MTKIQTDARLFCSRSIEHCMKGCVGGCRYGDAPGQLGKPKILVLGWARHGKDTVAEILRDHYGFSFQSSSHFCAEIVCRPRMAELGITYDSLEDCYADRVNHRATWYEAIKAYNADDPARLAKGILEDGDLYVGMRSAYEFAEARKLFDHIWWVDATARGLEPEDRSSMDIDWEDSFRFINNGGTLEDLHNRIAEAMSDIRAEAWGKAMAQL